MEITEAQLTEGTIVRFRKSTFSKGKLTVRIVPNNVGPVASIGKATAQGNRYAIFFGYRVRPADTSVSFGNRKVYCVNVNDIEIVQEGK